jgi:hypothetical protein
MYESQPEFEGMQLKKSRASRWMTTFNYLNHVQVIRKQCLHNIESIYLLRVNKFRTKNFISKPLKERRCNFMSVQFVETNFTTILLSAPFSPFCASQQQQTKSKFSLITSNYYNHNSPLRFRGWTDNQSLPSLMLIFLHVPCRVSPLQSQVMKPLNATLPPPLKKTSKAP